MWRCAAAAAAAAAPPGWLGVYGAGRFAGGGGTGRGADCARRHITPAGGDERPEQNGSVLHRRLVTACPEISVRAKRSMDGEQGGGVLRGVRWRCMIRTEDEMNRNAG
jgi:hypothetical protein